ncbi:hypothetical protein O6H91_Y239900 [Diphasiastrum complanatum]|nr:hypothetical protein O6H91_Y239900 [Diphasiastrum complanatum]
MVRGLVGGSHISCKGHRSTSKKKASIEAKECKANGKIKECKLDEQSAWSYVLSESMTVKADVGFTSPNELYISDPILQLKNNECITKDTNYVRKVSIVIDPFSAVVNAEQMGCESEKLGCEFEELGRECRVCIPEMAVNGTEQTDARGGFEESQQHFAIGSLNIMKQGGFKCREGACGDLNFETAAADCQDVDCATSLFENVESSSCGLPDSSGWDPFNKVTGSKGEKQSVCIIEEQKSIEESDRQVRALLFTDGSGVAKDFLGAGSVDSSNLFFCEVEVSNDCCSPALGSRDGKHTSQCLDLEGESGVLSSSLLSGADGETNGNRQEVTRTSNEVLPVEIINSLLNSKEFVKREFSCFSPQQDGSKSRMETTDDRASKSNLVDCLEENVNSQAQENNFQPGRLEDEIFNKEHEEVESVPRKNPIKGDSLLGGMGVEMSLCKYPTSHEASAFERNIYGPKLQIGESIANNENCKLSTPREIHTTMVPICTLDEEHKKSIGDLDDLGGLDDVLDLVISLDTQEIFIDPVDELFAPNYSKVIKIPMCFKTMKEKVQAQQYLSWQAFVDDFERICYNAMKYNQIRSNIWRAAKKLLCEGKKLLEKFETRGSKLADSIKEVADDRSLGLVSENPVLKDLENVSRGKNGLNDCFVTSRYQPSVNDFLEQKGIDGPIRGGGEALRESPDVVEDFFLDEGNYLKTKGDYKTDSKLQLSITSEEVEIEECTLKGAVREDSDSQATDYSSSFECSLGEGKSDSASTGLWDSTEVQSRLRNGSAVLLYPEDDALVVEPNERKKKALNQEWKTYRRGIEWRCRWLELRIKALQDQASRYDQFLEEREVKKRWRTEHGLEIVSATRVVPFTDKHIKQPVLHRKRRRNLEDSIDAAAFMSRHPLFSRYGSVYKTQM